MNYRMQGLANFCEMSPEVAAAWDRLWAASDQPTPFIHRSFLTALERSESACARTGWEPRPVLLLDEQGQPLAACPVYAKSHSYGEYVFDWSWAQAYEQLGRPYYPKWLIASPFSPVPGTRLLGASSSARQALANALTDLARDSGLSSMHCLFGDQAEHQAFETAGWQTRVGVQFHWINRGYRDFQDFCETLTQPRRKKIRAERRKVQAAGIRAEIRVGSDIRPEDWQTFYACYRNTYLQHGNPPYLTPAFFEEVSQTMPWAWVMSLGLNEADEVVGAALLATQPNQAAGSILYGRYWGALRSIDCLHFELSYYAPMEWAIAHGCSRFEGGAQGEHKLWRGFEPVTTYSSHWLAEPQFEAAVARFLEREKQGLSGYLSELNDRQPFREQPGQQGQRP